MKRTLTAAVALVTALGMAGLAQAQSSAGSSASPNTMTPSPAPSTMTPSAAAPTQSSSAISSRGAAAPSYQGQMNQAQTGATVGQPSQSQIQQAQQQLKSQGLYTGSIDGVVGPETQSALSQFQRQNGLPATAQLDEQTMDKLLSGSPSRTTGSSTYSPPAGTMNPATGGSATGAGARSTTR